jgi:hypothetical protein
LICAAVLLALGRRVLRQHCSRCQRRHRHDLAGGQQHGQGVVDAGHAHVRSVAEFPLLELGADCLVKEVYQFVELVAEPDDLPAIE